MKLILSGFILVCYFTNNNLAAKNVQENLANTLEFNNSSDLKTVKIHKQGWDLAEPIIELNSADKLLITFDDLSSTPGTYSYTIVHCDSEWNPSSLFLNDYMDGFEVNEIRDYSFSSGTIISYMHSRLELPNQDVRLKISGNYLIRIFNSYSPDEILLQRRFVVFEPRLTIVAIIRQPSSGEKRYSSQQLDLKVNTSGVRVSDPFSEIKTVVCQNYLFQGCYQDIRPVHIRGNEIDYSQPDALIFPGGNEFRIFDTKNLRYVGQGLQNINFHGGLFHVQLTPDQNRRRLRYSYYPDLNGRYVINLERSNYSQIEADYAWVYFTLNSPVELNEGKNVYLFGEFTGWQLSPSNQMFYNLERGEFEISLLLKQGAYSYRYLVANEETGEVDISHFEGNFFETENNYIILVYYKPLGSRYDRIIGYQMISTRR